MKEIKYNENMQDFRLPKNIKQMGQAEGPIRIYVEDYVVTFLNQMTQTSPMEEKLAILLGDTMENKGCQYTFISGAIAVDNINIQDDHIGFTSGIWSKIYDDIKNYFGDTKVVGWYLTKPGKSLKVSDKMTKIHEENFPGEWKMLFISDPVDAKDQFYVFVKGKLQLQKGYYIYYERNEKMQNYMIEYHKQLDTMDRMDQVFVDENDFVKSKKKDESKKEHRNILPIVGSGKRISTYATVMVILVMAISAITVIRRMNLDEVGLNSDYGKSKETIQETEIQETEEKYVSAWSEASEKETFSEGDDVQVVSSNTLGLQYTVEEGDTLAKISLKYYQSMAYVDAICKLNNIEDADYIYPGMKIILP